MVAALPDAKPMPADRGYLGGGGTATQPTVPRDENEVPLPPPARVRLQIKKRARAGEKGEVTVSGIFAGRHVGLEGAAGGVVRARVLEPLENAQQ